MASRKKYNHQKLAINLRAAGLLPKGYKPGALTKNQRDRVVKLTHRHPGPAYRPHEHIVKKLSWKDARTLKAAGYDVKLTGKRPTVNFRRMGAEELTYKKGVITRERPGYKTITDTRARDLFAQAEHFFKTRKPGQYLAISVNDAQWNRIIRSMSDFQKYIALWRQTYGEDTWQKIKDHLYIVEVTE
jgi:hypothetical protein